MESQQRSQTCEHEVRQISSQLTEAQQVLGPATTKAFSCKDAQDENDSRVETENKWGNRITQGPDSQTMSSDLS